MSGDIFDKLEIIAEVPNDEKHWGLVYDKKCTCGGTLQVMRVPGNGHVRAKCDKCGFRMVE